MTCDCFPSHSTFQEALVVRCLPVIYLPITTAYCLLFCLMLVNHQKVVDLEVVGEELLQYLAATQFDSR